MVPFKYLTERDRNIVATYLYGYTYADVGREFELSSQRIRQIVSRFKRVACRLAVLNVLKIEEPKTNEDLRKYRVFLCEAIGVNKKIVLTEGAGRATRAENFGEQMADAIMEAAHLTYNAARGRKMVNSCIDQLNNRIHELRPKKADPEYKKARYGTKIERD